MASRDGALARALAHFDSDGFQHLDEQGFPNVRIENAAVRMPASRTAPNHPWVCGTVAVSDSR